MPSVYMRQKNEQGKWRYVRVNLGPGRRPASLSGPFFVRIVSNGQTQWKPAGDTLENARKESETQRAVQEAIQAGVIEPEEYTSRLSARISAYLAEIKANKARKTHLAYANALQFFTKSCKRANVEDIRREDLLAFKTYLREQADLSDAAIYNNFLYAMIFVKWCGLRVGIKKNDWPRNHEREPEEYSEEEIIKLLSAARTKPETVKSPQHQRSQTDERLLLNSFLCTGLRSGELAHLQYRDIDFKHSVWTVRSKNDWDWKTKTEQSQRRVPVAEWLTKKIHERMIDGKHQPTDLVFPSRTGKPDRKLLNVVKRVAVRAGLLKVVKHENGKTTLVGMRVDDHKFRSTAITRWLREGIAPQEVMRWVGHKKLDTILRYAATINVHKAVAKAASAFEQFAGVGD